MSPLDDLLSTIETDAREERARLESASRAEAESILARARAEAETARKAPVEAQEPELRREVDRRLGAARLEAARIMREASHESFALFVSGLRERLASLRDTPEYPDLMRALFEEARAALPDARTLRVDPRDEVLAADLAREGGFALDPTLVTAGGLELASGNGSRIRNTVEERLASAEPALRMLYSHRPAAMGDEPGDR